MKRCFLVFLVVGMGMCIAQTAQSQFSRFYYNQHRPPNLNWQQLETPHFNIVFPEGEDSAAYLTGRILEHEYSDIQSLVGGGLQNFPVVLNNYNDLSNGFVSSTNFRSEIEIPPIKGKTMNPQSGNWLETVAPHELVHALHFSHLNGIWADVLGLFSPDAARSLHSTIPLGVHEGVATYHESSGVAPDGGRGNYPYFYNQFNSVFSGSGRWSLGQMLSVSGYTRPFDRHYIGGYKFTKWLQENYGPDATNEAIDFFIRWPFLGYGVALKHATGQWPGQLFNRFEEGKAQQLADQNTPGYSPLEIPFKGRELRRPVWLSEYKLLMYGSFYNSRRGFYIYDLDTGAFDRVLETRMVQDYHFDLSADKRRLLFSNYRPSPYYDRTYKMDLYETELSTGETRQLTKSLRGSAPAYHDGDLLAVQNDHVLSAIVRIDTAGPGFNIKNRITVPHTEFVSIKPNPANPDQLAVVANRRGLQGLWIVTEESMAEELEAAPEISFSVGSIFDPSWHPGGRILLFTSDHSGIMQIYEYYSGEGRVEQLTNSTFNAMEGAYSPGGDKIAFIIQIENEKLPVVLGDKNFTRETVPADIWKPSAEKKQFMDRPELGFDLVQNSKSWQISEYRPGLSWLKPRTVLPTFKEVSSSDTYQIGLGLHSTDLLQRNSYNLDLTLAQRLPWFDLTYRHTGFFPGFEISTFSEPSFPSIDVENSSGDTEVLTLLQQNLGISVGIPTQIVLESNSRFSAVGFTPSLELRGTRFYELDHNGKSASEFAHFLAGNFFSFLNYKLQQNIRDLQPNAGLVLYSEIEHFFNSRSTVINTIEPGRRIPVSFIKPTAWRTGLFLYTSPLRRWNQSLRVGLEGLTQTAGVFDNQSLVSDGFSEPIFPGARNMLNLSTRYTVPLFYPDNGGFLLPFYLSNVYMVGFTDTIGDLGQHGLEEFFSASRTVYGIGVRTRFRISNLTLDLGVGFGFELTRPNTNVFIGNF